MKFSKVENDRRTIPAVIVTVVTVVLRFIVLVVKPRYTADMSDRSRWYRAGKLFCKTLLQLVWRGWE